METLLLTVIEEYGCKYVKTLRVILHSTRRCLRLHVTDFMEQSPSWEGNSFSASQEIPRILWSWKVRYTIHKRPPPAPTLSQISSVHTSLSHVLKIHFNIILSHKLLVLLINIGYCM